MKFAGLIAIVAVLITGCAVYRPTGAWGYAEENAFLSSCELRARVAYCSCTLGYLEQTVSEQQVASDASRYFAGAPVSTEIQTAVNVCQLAVL